ncbi:hypothetical protein [Micromonospora aurantiaca (nom. illeg.)]|uniref:hypothetical protein n=1 Tax=Micromonospora aurantiaca (nom. illeg.) TaxID=47850 RepID=UPI0033C1E112
MSTDMQVSARRDSAGITLDVDRFLSLFRLIGCDTLTAIAAEIGLNVRQVRRARNGGVIGEVFMARTVAALQRHADRLAEYGHEPPTLDDLFTVTTAPAE